MIELRNLTKKFGQNTAVDSLSLVVRPGAVTGFLGPNGAGKSTTMKMILGLVRPTSGQVLVDGVPYSRLKDPIRRLGALVDPEAVNPNFTARQHLALMATAGGIGMERVAHLLKQTGLETAQHRRIGEFSLGMRQRLGIAAALLGDPETVILDEPFNGLDVDGIKWLRALTKGLAEQGKAVFVSSHLMSEVEAIADRVVVLAQGRLIADMTIDQLMKANLSTHVRVRSEDDRKLAAAVTKAGGAVRQSSNGTILVNSMEMEEIGKMAKELGLAIFELTSARPSLEDLFVELTAGSVEFQGQTALNGRGDAIW